MIIAIRADPQPSESTGSPRPQVMWDQFDALLAQGVDAARDLRRFRFFTTAFATRSQGIEIPHPHLLTAAVRGRRPLRPITCAASGPGSRGGGRRVLPRRAGGGRAGSTAAVLPVASGQVPGSTRLGRRRRRGALRGSSGRGVRRNRRRLRPRWVRPSTVAARALEHPTLPIARHLARAEDLGSDNGSFVNFGAIVTRTSSKRENTWTRPRSRLS